MMENMYNLNIERSVLSTLIFEQGSETSDYILNEFSSSDFYLPFHKNFYTVCHELNRASKPIEETFIRSALEKEKQFDEVAMLDILSASAISNVKAYVSTLHEYAQKRGLVNVSNYIKKRVIEEDAAPLDVIENSLKHIERVAESGNFSMDIKSMAYAEEAEPEFMTKGWLPIPKATVSMIVAPGSTGKTWLSLQLAIRMAREDAGRKIFLWLSEDPEGIVKNRYNAIIDKIVIGKKTTEDVQIAFSSEDPVLLLEGRGHTTTMSSRFYAIKRNLRKFDVIIIDPLLAFFGGDENDNSQARIFMQPFLNWARSENKVIIFLHHSKKGEAGNISKARGAGAFIDAVRCIYDMDKIYVKKSDGKTLDPLNLHMRTFTLSKDNYGAMKHLEGFTVQREITPKHSARVLEVEYEDAQDIDMPVLEC